MFQLSLFPWYTPTDISVQFSSVEFSSVHALCTPLGRVEQLALGHE